MARYDDWAIDFFRQKKLIWSSWGPMMQLESPDHNWFPDVRFLSLLWRAAATSLFEFKAVSLPANELAQLREMVHTSLSIS